MRFYLDNTISYIKHCQDDESWRVHLLDVADKACNNTFIFIDRYEMERCTTPVYFENKIDWNHVPFGDNEWCYAFNRHTFLLTLAKAYSLTWDEKYRTAWIRLFEDFFENSKLNEENKALSWRSLECGIRIENYIRSIEFFEDTKPLDSRTMEKIRQFFSIHIDYLLQCHTSFHRLSNWGVLQDHGLFLASAYLEDKKNAGIALERLEEELSLQTLNDGMHWEQSSTYHAEVLHAVLDTILVANRLGYNPSSKLLEKAHSLSLALSRSIRPDGYCHLFGDSDEMDVRDILLKAAIIFKDGRLSKGGNDNDFYSSFPLDIEIPENKKDDESFFFKDSGNAILNISKDTQLFFHCGFYGSGHGHLDQLHFNLWNKGEEIITDSGRYTYTDTKERYMLKGSLGHNTIIINGKEMADMLDSWGIKSFAEPLFMDAKLDGEYKWLSAAHLGYIREGAFVKRSILSIDGKYLIIFDEVKSKDQCNVSIPFHFAPESTIKLEGKKAAIQKGGSKIAMYFDSDIKCTTCYIAKHYNELLTSQCITVNGQCKSEKLFVSIISLNTDEIELREEKVYKPLTGVLYSPDISRGLYIKDKNDTYTVSFLSTEIPTDGFLTSCNGVDCFARVFVKKNDEDVFVIKY